MTARFFVDLYLEPGLQLGLPIAVARHVQVLRLQPGSRITLFNGQSHGTEGEGEFDAVVERMGRSDVDVVIGAHRATDREPARAVHLAVGMPANDRMDWLVEKATELGVASIQPLMTERTVLRLKADRADKKAAHWRGIAAAASEQSGRSRVPTIHEVTTLADWLGHRATDGPRWLLSLHEQASTLPVALSNGPAADAWTLLSGPEGGLSPQEETAALAAGFTPLSLGPRVLRSETAPLACLAFLSLYS